MRKIVLLVLCNFTISITWAQWSLVNCNITSDVVDVQMLDAANGYMITSGQFFSTNDGGSNWNLVYDGAVDALQIAFDEIYFKNLQEGFIVGNSYLLDKGIIRRTVDGGQTWTTSLTSGEYNSYTDIAFCDSIRGMVTGTFGSAARTIDGGQTWFTVSDPAPNNLDDVSFDPLYNSVGLIATAGFILRTTDYGFSWTSISLPGQNRLVQFAAPNIAYAYAPNTNRLYKSVNGGLTWQQVITNLPNTIGGCFFTSADTGYAIGNAIYRTTNGGTLWEKTNIDLGLFGSDMIYFYKDYLGFAGTNSNKMYKTANSGNTTWFPMASIALGGNYTCSDSTYSFSTINSANYSYQWKFNGQTFSTNSSGTTIMHGTTTTDTVTLIVSNGINNDTATKVFYTYGNINLNTSHIRTSRDTVCSGQSAWFYVDSSLSGVMYQLSANGINIGNALSGTGGTLNFSSSTITNTTIYTIKAYYNSICGYRETVIQKTIAVAGQGAGSISAVQSAICKYDTAKIEIQLSEPGITYKLYNGNADLGISVVGNGGTVYLIRPFISNDITFSVRATSNMGCTTIFSNVAQITVRSMVVDVNRIEDVYVGQDIELSNTSTADNYYWQFDSSATVLSSTDSLPAVPISYNTNGVKNILFVATTVEGCIDTLSYRVRVYDVADTSTAAVTCSFDSIIMAGNAETILAHHVDKVGNQYVAGYKYYTNGGDYSGAYHYFFQKFNPSGVKQWEKISNASMVYANSFYSGYVSGISTDPYGNVYVCGTYSALNFVFDSSHPYLSNNDAINMYAVKLDTAGNMLWFMHSSSNTVASPVKTVASDILYVDSNHILLVTSDVTHLHLPNDSVIDFYHQGLPQKVLVLNDKGEYLFNYSFMASGYTALGLYCPNTSIQNYRWSASVSPKMFLRRDGKVTFLGSFAGYCKFGNGTALTSLINIDNEYEVSGYAAVLNPYQGWENSFITYHHSGLTGAGTFGDRNIMQVADVDDDGNIYMAKLLEQKVFPYNSYIQLPNGQQFSDTAYSYIIIAYTPTGQMRFVKRINVPHVYSVAVSADNSNVYIAGDYKHMAGFEETQGNLIARKAYAQTDAFIARYDSSGSFIEVENIGNEGDQSLYSIKTNCSDILYGIGKTTDKAQIKWNTITTTQYCNIFVKYNPNGSNCQQQMSVCPFYITTYDTVLNCMAINGDTINEFNYIFVKDSATVYGSFNSIDTVHSLDTVFQITAIHITDTTHTNHIIDAYDAQAVIYYTNNIDSAYCTDSVLWKQVYTITDTVRITRTLIGTSISNVISSGIIIYPNPGNDVLYISNINESVDEVQLYTLDGKLKLSVLKPINNTIQTSKLPAGVYMIDITTRNARGKYRWIKL